MFSKFYEKWKQFIIENYLTLTFYLVFIVTLTYPLPFYISTGGGTINTENRVEIENSYEIEGSFHFAYVSQIHATIPTYLLAKVLPNWELEKIEDYQISKEETEEELLLREHLYLEEANTAAILNAYEKANKEITMKEQQFHVIYIENREKTNLKIGDIIKSVDGKKIQSFQELKEIIESHEVSDTISLEVLRENQEIECSAEIFEEKGQKYIGISIITTYDYQLDPQLTLKFKDSESGPSGGLTLALTIYNHLTEEDITKGKKIVGTGTIEMDGTVGSIGGVSYKLQGAVASKADIFIVPNGENYEECIKVKEEKNWPIEVIGVDSFSDALEKLNQLS